MVLLGRPSGRVGRRRDSLQTLQGLPSGGFFLLARGKGARPLPPARNVEDGVRSATDSVPRCGTPPSLTGLSSSQWRPCGGTPHPKVRLRSSRQTTGSLDAGRAVSPPFQALGLGVLRGRSSSRFRRSSPRRGAPAPAAKNRLARLRSMRASFVLWPRVAPARRDRLARLLSMRAFFVLWPRVAPARRDRLVRLRSMRAFFVL